MVVVRVVEWRAVFLEAVLDTNPVWVVIIYQCVLYRIFCLRNTKGIEKEWVWKEARGCVVE